MQPIPWFSTFTLFTEILVTAGVLYIFYQAKTKNIFHYKTAAAVLGYEILFNISYMASRTGGHIKSARFEQPWEIALAAFHGIFSLLMFLALLVFMALAWKNYKKGVNYFLVHKTLTGWFIGFWLLAVISGIVFYVVSYL